MENNDRNELEATQIYYKQYFFRWHNINETYFYYTSDIVLHT